MASLLTFREPDSTLPIVQQKEALEEQLLLVQHEQRRIAQAVETLEQANSTWLLYIQSLDGTRAQKETAIYSQTDEANDSFLHQIESRQDAFQMLESCK